MARRTSAGLRLGGDRLTRGVAADELERLLPGLLRRLLGLGGLAVEERVARGRVDDRAVIHAGLVEGLVELVANLGADPVILLAVDRENRAFDLVREVGGRGRAGPV